jgi:hypothetical protein
MPLDAAHRFGRKNATKYQESVFLEFARLVVRDAARRLALPGKKHAPQFRRNI